MRGGCSRAQARDGDVCASAALAAGDERLKAISVLEIVNDDMPFLVDSVIGELAERGLEVQFVVHPIFSVERDTDGRLAVLRTRRSACAGTARESFIHIHLARIDDKAQRRELTDAIEAALVDVRVSVQDWRGMLDRVAAAIADLKNSPPPLPVGEIAEAIQFLQWLTDDNFTFLGMRNYKFSLGEDSLDAGVRERARRAARARRARAAALPDSRSRSPRRSGPSSTSRRC